MAFLVVGEEGPNGEKAKHLVLGEASCKSISELAVAERSLAAHHVEKAVAIHDPTVVWTLLGRVLKGFKLPTKELSEYFGLRAGSYFAFLDSYTQSMVVPSLIYLAVRLMKVKATPSRVAAMRVASRIAISCWALKLVQTVNRRSPIKAVLAQSTLLPETSDTPQEETSNLDARRKRMQAISANGAGPSIKDYVVSAATTSAMLVGVGTWIVFSMNCQGYILNRESRFAVNFVQNMAAPGGLLDTQHAIKGLIAPITHSQVMAFLNVRYSAVVEKLSCRDGTGHHGTIAKRLCFEMMDNFMPITWIAFVRRDSEALSSEVISCYQTDEVRRMATETVIPYALHAISRHRSGVAPAAEDAADLDEWEDFDEWLEMLTQFAYIAFLGPDSPIVFPLSLLSNYLEQRSDLVKVCFCTRRPRPENRDGLRDDMKTWIGTLTAFAYAGVAMNALGVFRIMSGSANGATHPLMH